MLSFSARAICAMSGRYELRYPSRRRSTLASLELCSPFSASSISLNTVTSLRQPDRIVNIGDRHRADAKSQRQSAAGGSLAELGQDRALRLCNRANCRHSRPLFYRRERCRSTSRSSGRRSFCTTDNRRAAPRHSDADRSGNLIMRLEVDMAEVYRQYHASVVQALSKTSRSRGYKRAESYSSIPRGGSARTGRRRAARHGARRRCTPIPAIPRHPNARARGEGGRDGSAQRPSRRQPRPRRRIRSGFHAVCRVRATTAHHLDISALARSCGIVERSTLLPRAAIQASSL